jgi:hypothetical protein
MEDQLSSDPDNMPPRSRLFLVVPKTAEARVIQVKSGPGVDMQRFIRAGVSTYQALIQIKSNRDMCFWYASCRAVDHLCLQQIPALMQLICAVLSYFSAVGFLWNMLRSADVAH